MSTDLNNGYRRYSCQRSYPLPGLVRTCTAPQAHADAIEAYVWAEVSGLFTSRDAIGGALRQASDPGESGARHASQVATLRADIAALERRITNAAAIMEEFGPGTQTYEDTLARQRQNEATRTGHLELLASLERQAPVVLGEDEIAATLRAWDRLAAGVRGASQDATTQRMVYRALGLRIEARLDGAGVLLGRKHRWSVRVTWRGQVLDSAGDPCGYIALWDSQPDDGGPLLRLVGAADTGPSSARSAASRARIASPNASSTRSASTKPGSAGAHGATIRTRAG
jgi:hypothetical protein